MILAVDPARVNAGPIGLLIVLLLVIATVLLIRNMNKRLKRLPREFPADHRDLHRSPEPPPSPRLPET